MSINQFDDVTNIRVNIVIKQFFSSKKRFRIRNLATLSDSFTCNDEVMVSLYKT